MAYFSSNSYCSLDGKRFDVLKVFLSIFVVSIHTTPVGACFRPVIRVAIPLFFIMTSYFFFLNQNKLTSLKEKKAYLLKYVKRIVRLYGFWFIILLPVTVAYQKLYVNFGFDTIINLLHRFLFGSTFRASWFLMASFINIVFVWYVSQKISNNSLLVLGFFMYLICCLFSNYYYFITNQLLIELYYKYVSLVSIPYNSFPAALLFVMFGKYLAEHPIFIPNKLLLFFLVLSVVLLYVEFYMIETNMAELSSTSIQIFRNDDSFLFLIPFSLFLFIIIGQNYMRINVETQGMRRCSTIVYCCHCSIATVVHFVLTRMGMDAYYLLFFLTTLSLSLFVYIIIDYLVCKLKINVFRWAY